MFENGMEFREDYSNSSGIFQWRKQLMERISLLKDSFSFLSFQKSEESFPLVAWLLFRRMIGLGEAGWSG